MGSFPEGGLAALDQTDLPAMRKACLKVATDAAKLGAAVMLDPAHMWLSAGNAFLLARAAALLEGHVIDTADLDLDALASSESSGDTGAPDDTVSAEVSTEAASGDLDGYLCGIERTIIEEALQTHRWNRTATAKSLGITLRSLRYRLKKLGIED